MQGTSFAVFEVLKYFVLSFVPREAICAWTVRMVFYDPYDI